MAANEKFFSLAARKRRFSIRFARICEKYTFRSHSLRAENHRRCIVLDDGDFRSTRAWRRRSSSRDHPSSSFRSRRRRGCFRYPDIRRRARRPTLPTSVMNCSTASVAEYGARGATSPNEGWRKLRRFTPRIAPRSVHAFCTPASARSLRPDTAVALFAAGQSPTRGRSSSPWHRACFACMPQGGSAIVLPDADAPRCADPSSLRRPFRRQGLQSGSRRSLSASRRRGCGKGKRRRKTKGRVDRRALPAKRFAASDQCSSSSIDSA